VSVFVRGFIFGDGIYEGLRSVVVRGKRRVIGMNRHARRMQSGLDAIGIRFDAKFLAPLTDKLLDANGLDNAFIYWQVTRGTPLPGMPVRSRVPGTAPAGQGMTPTIFGYATSWPGLVANAAPAIKPATTQPDLRWARGEIKSVSLLGNVLASLASAEHGGSSRRSWSVRISARRPRANS
jgi:D-alanine transaminase